jgi:hypothetical protein
MRFYTEIDPSTIEASRSQLGWWWKDDPQKKVFFPLSNPDGTSIICQAPLARVVDAEEGREYESVVTLEFSKEFDAWIRAIDGGMDKILPIFPERAFFASLKCRHAGPNRRVMVMDLDLPQHTRAPVFDANGLCIMPDANADINLFREITEGNMCAPVIDVFGVCARGRFDSRTDGKVSLAVCISVVQLMIVRPPEPTCLVDPALDEALRRAVEDARSIPMLRDMCIDMIKRDATTR